MKKVVFAGFAKYTAVCAFLCVCTTLFTSCGNMEVRLVDIGEGSTISTGGYSQLLEDTMRDRHDAEVKENADTVLDSEVTQNDGNEEEVEVIPDENDLTNNEPSAITSDEHTSSDEITREQIDLTPDNKARTFANALLADSTIWELTNVYSWGYYENGYAFFDLDNDGELEFLTQYGGGTMADCTTRVFKCRANGEIEFVSEGNFSYLDLMLYKDKRENGGLMYIENKYGRIGSARSFTFTGKFNFIGGVYSFDEYFSVVYDFDGEGKLTNTAYKFNMDDVTKEDYISYYDGYFRILKRYNVSTDFIGGMDWQELSENNDRFSTLVEAYLSFENDVD